MRLGSPTHSRRAIAQRLWFALAAPAVTYRLGEPLFRWLGRRRTGPDFELSAVQRVLVVRLDKIGDMVLSTPLLRELRRNLPNAWITLAVSPAARGVVVRCPYVDEIQTYDWRASRYLGPFRHLHTLRKAARHLWDQQFDLAIVPCWGVDYYFASFLAYFSGAPWRLGYSEHVVDAKQQLNRGFDRLLTHVSPDGVVKHEVEHNLDLIRYLGGAVQSKELELWTGDDDEEQASQLLRTLGMQAGELLVALAPGAGAPRRCWPIERFGALASWLKGTYGAKIVILGGTGEEELGRALARPLGASALDLVGRTTLLQTAAILKRCHLFVGNDSGPMHLAAAARTCVIEISCHPRDGSAPHQNSPERFGPWGTAHTVVQPELALDPCSVSCAAVNAHCIQGVSLEQVKVAVAGRVCQRHHV